MGYSPKNHDSPEDIAMQKEIISRANYSASILGMSFIYRGGGKFLNIRSPKEAPRKPNAKSIDDAC
ncbi:MAG: hypothetical protein KJ646_03700 [Nanoarchaeota archaeon]|nr:hypothetical protein [Nanoarchaeota archaeon]MBU4116168.1 hypothetical protein [Nanoarchaeota archaeon]